MKGEAAVRGLSFFTIVPQEERLMDIIRENAYAKLNLSLDVLGKRDDGFHDMEMIFQLISLQDHVTMRVRRGEGIRVLSSLRYLPSGPENIAYRCAMRFLQDTGLSGWEIEISLDKKIPVGSGLGGGSADGAAVLRGLNRYFDHPLTEEELMMAADSAGSDIPFCLMGGTALAHGKGEILEALPPLIGCGFVVVKPSFSVSTPELFRKLDSIRVTLHPDTEGLVQAIRVGNTQEIGQRLFNVFEDALGRDRNTVSEIKSALLDAGAIGASMTGTGSAVFGMFPDGVSADRAAEILSRRWNYCMSVRPVSLPV